jgi:putative tryptophan/tyrosine transport system substrate-binding protein
VERRTFLTGSVSLLTASSVAEAQPTGRIYRIGELREGTSRSPKPFTDAMRDLGWIEGQHFTLERRNADRRDQLPALAAELVRLKVDLVLTGGTPAARAAKEATNTIPIVFSVADDPVGSGLVASFSRPGGNLTGFTLGVYDEKLLEVLKETIPGATRVAYAAPAQETGTRPERLNAAARVLGVEVRPIVVQGPKDFDRFFASAKDLRSDAMLVPNVAWFRPHLERIGFGAAKSRLPAIGYDRGFARSGGLLSYGPVPLQNVPRVAAQVDKILKGANPADLPVEQPTKFELVINLKTAKALGLTIPLAVLARADEIIE